MTPKERAKQIDLRLQRAITHLESQSFECIGVDQEHGYSYRDEMIASLQNARIDITAALTVPANHEPSKSIKFGVIVTEDGEVFKFGNVDAELAALSAKNGGGE